MRKSSIYGLVRKLVGRKNQLPPVLQQRCKSCDQALVAEATGEHSVLRCPACRGTWLTASSLGAALSEKSESEELLMIVGNDGEADIAHTFAPSRLARVCPCCPQSMENHKFEDSGVWIDTCPQGHGIWLDRGELKLLTERRRSGPNTATPDLEDTFEDVVSDILLGYL